MDWKTAEQYARDLFGLEGTIGSGNKFYDPSDSVDRTHYSEQPFKLSVETKSTVNKSYSLSEKLLLQWKGRDDLNGRVFVLHVEFQSPPSHKSDWVLLDIHDFLEIRDHRSQGQKDAIEGLKELVSRFKDEDQREKYMKMIEVL